MGHIDIYDRMAVNIPEGEVRGMQVARFEVIAMGEWRPEHEKRRDVASPLALARAIVDGRAPKPGWYTRLSENGIMWMSDTTAEREDHAAPVFAMSTTKAERVVIGGLGIGMVLSAALSFDHVKHVDVIESDDRVIELVGPHYLKDPRVTIHHADAFEQMDRWPADARWDVGWMDIWPDICVDNLAEMKRFTDFYGPRCGEFGNWSEDICKRRAWDNRDWEEDYLEFLTDEEQQRFEEEDEEDELWEDEEDDE